MPGLIVKDELQAYLVAQGVGQYPAAAPSLVVPSIWTKPRQEAPLPRREGDDGDWLENMTVTISDPNLAGPPGLASDLEDTFIDITIRSLKAAEGELLQRAILNLLHPRGSAQVGKRNWQMNNLRVLYSARWRNDREIPARDAAAVTYDRAASYRFTCARSDLG